MCRVLIADDEQSARVVMSAIIKHSCKTGKVSVDEAENGEEALKKIKEKGYDFILLDVCMPISSGVEFLAKGNRFLNGSKVLLYTALPEDSDEVKFCKGVSSKVYYIGKFNQKGIADFIKQHSPDKCT